MLESFVLLFLLSFNPSFGLLEELMADLPTMVQLVPRTTSLFLYLLSVMATSISIMNSQTIIAVDAFITITIPPSGSFGPFLLLDWVGGFIFKSL